MLIAKKIIYWAILAYLSIFAVANIFNAITDISTYGYYITQDLNELIRPLLIILVITILFHRQWFDSKVKTWYNNFSRGDVNRESLFINIFLFLYFILVFFAPMYAIFRIPPGLAYDFSAKILLGIGSPIFLLLLTFTPLAVFMHIAHKEYGIDKSRMAKRGIGVGMIIASIFAVLIFVWSAAYRPGGESGLEMVGVIGMLFLYLIFLLIIMSATSLFLMKYYRSVDKTRAKWFATVVLLIIFSVMMFGNS